MNRLPDMLGMDASSRTSPLEDSILQEKAKKSKVAKNLINNAGILVGVFIMFAVVVIVTTDIRIVSLTEITSLGLDFFLLCFCSYSMYVACSDSGMRAGLLSKSYADAIAAYEVKKRAIFDEDLQDGVYEFCREYVANELKNARMSVLAPQGFIYESYEANWLTTSEKDILAVNWLTEPQKRAIIKANRIKPIKLNPEQIIRKGRNEGKRAPLSISPRAKKKIAFGTKFFTTLFLSLGIALIALEFAQEPSWEAFAAVTLKLLTIVINGFSGYKFGFENIVVDTVDYLADQTDLLEQAYNYIKKQRAQCQEGGTSTCANAT